MQNPENIPFLTTDQMREVDRLMVDEFGISLIQMMENAGRNLADVARDFFLDGDVAGRRVSVLCGAGGNGGGGLVAARRLLGWNADVEVWLSRSHQDYRGVPARQLAILQKMGASIREARGEVELAGDLIIDALIGYSLSGPPAGVAAALIRAANASDAPVLSLDAPSGIDTTTGTVHEPAVRADATMTLALPKQGLRSDEARANVGDLYLADIGVPLSLYSRPSLGLQVAPIFRDGEIVRIWQAATPERRP